MDADELQTLMGGLPVTMGFYWRWKAIVDDDGAFWFSHNVERDTNASGQPLSLYSGSLVVATSRVVAVFEMKAVHPLDDSGGIKTTVRPVSDIGRIEIITHEVSSPRTWIRGKAPKNAVALHFRDGFVLHLPRDASGTHLDGLFIAIGWR